MGIDGLAFIPDCPHFITPRLEVEGFAEGSLRLSDIRGAVTGPRLMGTEKGGELLRIKAWMRKSADSASALVGF